MDISDLKYCNDPNCRCVRALSAEAKLEALRRWAIERECAGRWVTGADIIRILDSMNTLDQPPEETKE